MALRKKNEVINTDQESLGSIGDIYWNHEIEWNCPERENSVRGPMAEPQGILTFKSR